MKRVLFVVGWYPPCQQWPTAARRAAQLASGLQDRRWDVTVVAPELRGLCPCAWCSDPHRADQPAGVVRVPVSPTSLRRSVRRVKSLRQPRSVDIDSRGGSSRQRLDQSLAWALLGWQTTWAKRALEVARGLPADVILTTSGPFENLSVGHALQRETGRPWIADLRDPASVDVTFEDGSFSHIVRLSRLRYRRHLKAADAVTAATQQVVTEDSEWLGRPIELLLPGYDEELWAEARSRAPSRHERFEVVFTGRLYPGYRGPEAFLRGMALFAERHARQDVHLVYYGRDGATLLDAANAVGCAHLVEDRGFIDPASVPERLVSASLLLLLTNDAADSGVPGGKFFEYLGARRPILAVPGGDDFVESVLRRTKAGHVATAESDVASLLEHHVAAWSKAGVNPFVGVESALATYGSAATSDRLVRMLNAVVEDKRLSDG